MGDRCSGNCCREFALVIGDTPEQIVERLLLNVEDGKQIAEMIIPLRPIVPGGRLPNGEVAPHDWNNGGWIFTCKHFNATTGNCDNYVNRPKHMCAKYPYGHPCEHKDQCTWDAGRTGTFPLVIEGYDDKRHLRVTQPDGNVDQSKALLELRIQHDSDLYCMERTGE